MKWSKFSSSRELTDAHADAGLDEAGRDLERLVDDTAAHRPAEQPDAVVVDGHARAATKGLDGVDDVEGVPDPEPPGGQRVDVGAGVVAVVDMERHEPLVAR